jgi:hypothetical protein
MTLSKFRPEGTHSRFRAVIRQFGESIDADFGDHNLFSANTHRNTIQDPSSTLVVSLTEFPWAAGEIDCGTSCCPTFEAVSHYQTICMPSYIELDKNQLNNMFDSSEVHQYDKYASSIV